MTTRTVKKQMNAIQGKAQQYENEGGFADTKPVISHNVRLRKVHLKLGEKVFGLNLETLDLEEVELHYVKGKGKCYEHKEKYVYTTARTLSFAQVKIEEYLTRKMEEIEKKKANENNRKHSDTAGQG